jgi:hypothetical protein
MPDRFPTRRPQRPRATGLFAVLALAFAGGLVGCSADTAGSGEGVSGRSRGAGADRGGTHYVDVYEWDGRPITALDAGRPRVIVTNHAPVASRRSSSPLPEAQGSADESAAGGQSGDAADRRTLPDGAANGRRSAPAADAESSSAAALPAPPPSELPAAPAGGPVEASAVWAIPLATSASANHQLEIQDKFRALVAEFPQLRPGLWVHSNERGSKIMYGRFEGVDDDSARTQLAMLKSLVSGDRRPFASSFIARVELGATAHAHDIRTLRRRMPHVDPLYTLDIATWISSDEGGEAEWSEMKRRAEAYAAQLRAQGIEAWFYHGESQRVTSVTVGAFDRTVVNPVSGLYDDALRDLVRRFPVRLTNGEPLMLPVNPRDRNSPLKAQEPIVVEVPQDLN